MKTVRILSLLAAALILCQTFSSCDNEKPGIEQENNGDKASAAVQAFFPTTYAHKEVAAWYSVFSEEDYKKKVQAVFLFTDSTIIITKSKIYTEEDGRAPSRVTMYEGKYQMTEGDFTNGKATVTLNTGATFDIEIVNGKLSVMDETYTKQDKANIPAATESTENEFIGTVQAYLPAFSDEMTVAAWYTDTTQEARRIKIDAIFLFTDSTFLSTSSKFYTQKDGRKPSYTIMDIGIYKLTEGDFTNGKAYVTISVGDPFEAVINNGQLTARDEVFTMQNLANLPEPLKN